MAGTVTVLVAMCGVAFAGPAQAAEEPSGPIDPALRRVVFVGNNWAGTADLLHPATFQRIDRINIVPDKAERMLEIARNPYRFGFFLAIRTLIGEGHDQLVDDMYSSNDGKLLIVSRPSFADVVAISLKSHKIVWRFAVDGVRSDHMALSPDGKVVVVSASTGNVVHALRVKDGKEIGSFPSGGSPHESVFLDGGRKILHASIGTVYTPGDDPRADALKGARTFQLVDAKSYKILRRYNVRKALDEVGLTDTSIAVRPMTVTPDEKSVYFQLSFLHGFVQMDLKSGKIIRHKMLPNLVPNLLRELYVLDSAHHGIAISPDGSRLCVAGTMSDYAVVVGTKRFKRKSLLFGGLKPYWVTQSWNGKQCYISWAGSDTVSQIDFRTAKIIRTVKVGDHPQRIRNGVMRKAYAPKG